MINPTQITNFNRTDAELETFWIFCLLVAGKNSDIAATKTLALLSKRGAQTPFEYLRANENFLHNLLVANKVGQYGRLEAAIKRSLSLNLRTATLDELLSVFGVGPKTARFFLLHSRADCKCAVLDVHILRWMREQGVDAPEQTPNPRLYEQLEIMFLYLAGAHFPGVPIAQVDLLLWAKMSGRLD